jgi:hypothetical protein
MGVVVIRKLILTDLERGLPGITPEVDAACSQAASVCLENQKHQAGVEMTLTGDEREVFAVEWRKPDARAIRAWSDLPEAVESGACAVAFLVMLAVTDFTVIGRSVKGTGIDYWLGKKRGVLFQHAARLEVSGILRGDAGQVERRAVLKRRQSRRSNATMIPGYVVVVEFSMPTTKMVTT